MQLLKNHAHIYGFEDYNIVALGCRCLIDTWGFYLPWGFDNSTGTYIINKDMPVRIYNKEHPDYPYCSIVETEPELVINHKELLDTAKKVFTHPTCRLSRSMMAEKYKKSLNPFLSDAIVVPKPDYSEFNLRKTALFINEQAKVIVKIETTDDDSEDVIQKAIEGTKVKDLIASQPVNPFGTHGTYKTDDILEAELFYYGEVLFIPNSQSWALEVLTHTLPADKTIFEETIQESLSSETNQLDFDSLCSIKDMLDSSDENTQAAGLKSLSMMDWMHYPNSIKFMMEQTSIYKWRYNKACNSTSVKYMLKTITGTTNRRRWPGSLDSEIYAEDFELFKQLKAHYHHIPPQDILNYIRSFNFIRVNDDGLLVPKLKQRVA